MDFIQPTVILNNFRKACNYLNIFYSPVDIESLCVYDMTDGTRTSTTLTGKDAYIDGGLFALRLLNVLRVIGCKNAYINVIHTGHKKRENYKDVYNALISLADIYLEYAKKYNVKLKFLGNFEERIDYKESSINFIEVLKSIEQQTKNNNNFTCYILINFSTKYLAKHEEIYQNLPENNVIIRHTKGYINGDMQIFGRMDNYSLVYVQNGSSSINWSDSQIIFLVGICLRSYLINKGTHLTKTYKEGENEKVRQERELNLSLIHKDLYQDINLEENAKKFKKRAIIFSPVGPEIYEF